VLLLVLHVHLLPVRGRYEAEQGLRVGVTQHRRRGGRGARPLAPGGLLRRGARLLLLLLLLRGALGVHEQRLRVWRGRARGHPLGVEGELGLLRADVVEQHAVLHLLLLLLLRRPRGTRGGRPRRDGGGGEVSLHTDARARVCMRR
jgi:hypothetical protein